MFFYLSKIIGFFLQPSSLVLLLLLVATSLVLTRRCPVWAARLLATGVGLLLVCGLSPLGNWLVLPLESRFERPALPETAAGIIMLGGFESTSVTRARGHLSVNEAADRLTETLVLAGRLPAARVIFTGGEASLVRNDGSAAGAVSRFLRDVGIDPARIVLEERSRTTYENALYLRDMLQPKPGERYLLVTSAFHMPRSVAVFRRQGFDVVPWPVDYRTAGAGDALEWFGNIESGLERVDLAFREWIGLVAYRLTGRTAALWPVP